MHLVLGCLESREPSNGTMVRLLRNAGALTTERVTAAMLGVDRGAYLGHSDRQLNYADMPIKIGDVHLSAPSIYASALEALDIRPGCSFLHIGSGTGYLSTVVARMAGPHTVNHGVEHNARLVQLAAGLAAARPDAQHVEFFHANALQLRVEPPPSGAAESAAGASACCMKYDRIYVSAAALPEHRHFFKLLRQGGVLVGPFEGSDEFGRLFGQQSLVKVTRVTSGGYEEERLQPVQFAPLRQPAQAELAAMPPLVLAPLVWSPEQHRRFPPRFRAAVVQLLLASAHSASPLALLPRELLLRTISHLPFFAFEPRAAIELAPAGGASRPTGRLFGWLARRGPHWREGGSEAEEDEGEEGSEEEGEEEEEADGHGRLSAGEEGSTEHSDLEVEQGEGEGEEGGSHAAAAAGADGPATRAVRASTLAAARATVPTPAHPLPEPLIRSVPLTCPAPVRPLLGRAGAGHERRRLAGGRRHASDRPDAGARGTPALALARAGAQPPCAPL